MAVTFAELLRPSTQAEVKALIVAVLTVAGFPVSAWQVGGVALTIIDGFAAAIAHAWQAAYYIAAGGYGATARGLWLDMWADDRFQLERNLATTTEGTVTLTDAGGGPHNLAAGGLIVSTSDGKRFISTAAVVVPLDGSATVAVEASATGSTYNVPIGTITTMVTDVPSCTVSNPALAGSDTWITSAGSDDESDPELYARCRAQWATLSVASPKGYYEAVAKAAAPTVSKVVVIDDNPHGPGTVELVIATGAGPASAGDIILVDAAIQAHRSVGSGAITVVSATAVNVDVAGVAYVTAASLSAARAAIAEELTEYQDELAIAGTVLAARIVKIVMSQDGVRDFVPPDGLLVDVGLGDTEVATLTHSITYVAE